MGRNIYRSFAYINRGLFKMPQTSSESKPTTSQIGLEESAPRTINAFTIFRIAFGLVWVIDGIMKFVWLQPSDVVNLVQGAGQGQPSWLQPWYNFWIASVASAPASFLYGIGAIELALGFALVIGFLRKTAYLGGVVLSLMIWSIDEGFGGPYGPGATDIGAAIMYAFLFVGIIILERSADYNKYSLDVLIVRSWDAWRHISELYSKKQASSRRFRVRSPQARPLTIPQTTM